MLDPTVDYGRLSVGKRGNSISDKSLSMLGNEANLFIKIDSVMQRPLSFCKSWGLNSTSTVFPTRKYS